jgi:hypothetical protein
MMSDLLDLFRKLGFEQRVAAVAALLLAVSTFGPFSLVELAEILIAAGVLALLRARALGKRFHLPFGDGTVIAAAGVWAGLLIVVRLFDRPLGQNLLALVCAALLAFAGVLERAKRPPDDLPPETEPTPRRRPRRRRPDTTAVGDGDPLPPPEFKPYKPEPGEQLRLGGEEGKPQPPPPGDA